MNTKIPLITTLFLMSLSHLHATLESQNRESGTSYISYNLSKSKKNIFQYLASKREEDKKIDTNLPIYFHRNIYREDQCHDLNIDDSTLPIGCIKIKIKNDTNMI